MDLSALNVFDAVILSILLLSCVFAFVRGFVRTIFSLMCWGLSIFLGIIMAPFLIGYLEGRIESVYAVVLLAYVGGFIVLFTLFSIVFGFAMKLVQPACDGFIDRSLGAALGLVRGSAVACLIFSGTLSFCSLLTDNRANPDYKGPPWLETAQTYNFLNLSSSLFGELIPSGTKGWLEKRISRMGNLTASVIADKEGKGGGEVEISARGRKTLDSVIAALPSEAIDSLDDQFGSVSHKMLAPEEKLDLHLNVLEAYEKALAKGEVIKDNVIPPSDIAALREELTELAARYDAEKKLKEKGGSSAPGGKESAYTADKREMMDRLVNQLQQ